MNQTVRRRRRTKYAELEEAIKREAAAKDSLLDIVNVLLARQGGTVSVPITEIVAARRHHVSVVVKPPDPVAAGSEARWVISLEDFERKDSPARKDGPSFLERIGLWVPGR
jgi:hypothetical protein